MRHTRRLVKRLLLGLVILSAMSCGSDSSGPSSTPSAEIAGVWRGTLTTNSVNDSAGCHTAFFQAATGGSGSVTMTFTQAGDAVSATQTNASSSLNYTGSVAQNAVTMSGTSCSGCDLMAAQCPDSNNVRDIRVRVFTMNGTVAGNSLSGMVVANYNVFIAGTSAQVGTLSASESFTLTRQ